MTYYCYASISVIASWDKSHVSSWRVVTMTACVVNMLTIYEQRVSRRLPINTYAAMTFYPCNKRFTLKSQTSLRTRCVEWHYWHKTLLLRPSLYQPPSILTISISPVSFTSTKYLFRYLFLSKNVNDSKCDHILLT